MMHPVKNHGFARKWILMPALAAAMFTVVSCGKDEATAPQPPAVTVGKPTIDTVREFAIFTGSSRAVETADVVARVAGILETVEFEPSTPVTKGQLLFTVEKGRYRAERDAAEAALKSAEADLRLAETELVRVERASRSRAVSEVDVDRARAKRDMAIAAVASARAKLDDAELTYSYTDIVSPIDGVASRQLVDPGNLVGQSGPTMLTRINKLQPIYAYFNAPESIVLNFLAAHDGRPGDGSGPKVTARLALTGDTGYPHEGRIDFIDNEVNPETGTIEMRMRLENEDLDIFPGLFVRIKVEGAPIPDAVLVPRTAVGSDLGGKYVLIVGENDIVEQRYVVLGEDHGEGLVHIREGLDGQETLIVNGIVYARPGLPVTPLTPEQFAARQQQAADR